MGLFNFWKKDKSLPQQKTKRISRIGKPMKSDYLVTCEIMYNNKALSTVDLQVKAYNGIQARGMVDGKTTLKIAKVSKVKQLNKK